MTLTENQVFKLYGFGEITLYEACKMSQLNEEKFLRSYDLWIKNGYYE